MTTGPQKLRPWILGGRLRGFRDENGFPVALKDAGIPTMVSAPMIRQMANGGIILSGGDPDTIVALAESLEGRSTDGTNQTQADAGESPPDAGGGDGAGPPADGRPEALLRGDSVGVDRPEPDTPETRTEEGGAEGEAEGQEALDGEVKELVYAPLDEVDTGEVKGVQAPVFPQQPARDGKGHFLRRLTRGTG